MGVVCCEAPPQLAHDDIDNSGHHDPLSPSGTATVALAAGLPSDRPDGSQAALKPTPSLNQAKESANKTNQAKIPQDTKKSVRISDEVTLIPLLTSASFFRKTPKPTTITSNSHGIMPSFRIVTSVVMDQDSQESLVPKSSLWWTKEERKEILHANQKASRDFKRFQPTKMREANLVYSEIVTDCCDRHECHSHLEHSDDDDEEDISDFFRRERFANAASSTSSTGASRSKKRKRSECSNLDFDPPEISDLTIDLPTIVRGLEWGVMPDAKRYRKAHAKTVLRWQDRFRRMNERRRKQPKRIHWDSTESSSSSSSSGSSSEGEDSDNNSTNCEKTMLEQQDILAQKATISSLRSCMLARVFGKSDAMAANPNIATASELEDRRLNSSSPSPSLTGTESSESDNDDEDENDDSDSDDESESECDSDDESEDEDEQEHQQSFRSVSYCGYYSRLHSSPNSQKRMFRPRMMPPPSWR